MQRLRCPSCQRPVDHEAETCYSCGYSSKHARVKFGTSRVKMCRVHDVAACLRVNDTREIDQYFDLLEERFPQFVFAVYTGELNGNISLGELGFWLLNQAQIESRGEERNLAGGVLLLVDVETRKAGLTLGYFSESYIDAEESLRALSVARSEFANGEFGAAVLKVFGKIEKALTKKSNALKSVKRSRRQSFVRGAHHGTNVLPLSSPVITMAKHLEEKDKQPRRLVFRNEFESDWEQK